MGPVENVVDEPDAAEPNSGNPPSYVAIRTSSALYVQYKDGARECYNLKRDPYELHNVYVSLSPKVKSALQKQVVKLEGCHYTPACSQVMAGWEPALAPAPNT
jgi:hypothetical protein